ncbi:peptidase M23 [Streptomyces sp. ME02-8801-2C]|uniref:peptidase M23 n=1 Tax=Streptomyces sp. ME02-8801-2C TaxID=3028680 RepID=UPI0029B26673|nr:peptidase M23 [Streptomyces sp. ME02-8801-2C]MDX3453162.1 peptidase M23 [Streptomyces sp. ME02-8801-2C]
MTSNLRAAARSLRRVIPAGAVATAAALPLLVPSPAQATTADAQVYVWATGVNVRACPETSAACPPISGAQIGRRYVTAFCQRQGSAVVDGPYRNNWWVQVNAGGPIGWISAVYIRGGDNDQPVPGLSTDSFCQ